MPAVRRTVHLAYTMGHTAGTGAELRDDDLAAHAVRLARALHGLRPDDSECTGLLALVVLTEARAAGRLGGRRRRRSCSPTPTGRRGTGALLAEGLALVAGLDVDRSGVLGRQAAIAAEHARATSFEATDWGRIIEHYDALLRLEPSPTIAIGRCVAVAHRYGAAAGLADLDGVLDDRRPRRLPVRPRRPGRAARAARADRTRRRRRGATAAGCARSGAERDWFASRGAGTAAPQ